MEMLTIAIIAVVVVLLLAGLVVGRRFISRAGESSQFPPRQNDIRPQDRSHRRAEAYFGARSSENASS